MKIARDTVVLFDYTLRSDEGEVLDTSEGGEPLAYLHGHGQIVPGLESALEAKDPGDSFEVKIPPAEGYGERDDEAVFEFPRAKLPKGVEPKVGLELASRDSQGRMFRFRLIKIGEEMVTADANHPLAGQNLNFHVTVRDVRAASPEELEHGHVHGPGGAHA